MMLLLSLGTAAQAELRVFTPQDVLDDLDRHLLGRDISTLTDYNGPHFRRDVAETIMFFKAARLGGFSEALSSAREGLSLLKPRRVAALISQGEFLASTSPSDGELTLPNLAYSRPVMRAEEFVAGIYVSAQHPILDMPEPDRNSVMDLTLIVPHAWERDVATIQRVGWKYVYSNDWITTLQMLLRGRGDAVLAPFQPNDSMRFDTDVLTLRPVPGFKVSLDSRRAFLMHTGSETGQRLLAAVNRGIRQLRERGELKKMYTASGAFNEQVQDWVLLP